MKFTPMKLVTWLGGPDDGKTIEITDQAEYLVTINNNLVKFEYPIRHRFILYYQGKEVP